MSGPLTFAWVETTKFGRLNFRHYHGSTVNPWNSPCFPWQQLITERVQAGVKTSGDFSSMTSIIRCRCDAVIVKLSADFLPLESRLTCNAASSSVYNSSCHNSRNLKLACVTLPMCLACLDIVSWPFPSVIEVGGVFRISFAQRKPGGCGLKFPIGVQN